MKSKHVFRIALIVPILFCLVFAATTYRRFVAAQEVAATPLYLTHLNPGEGWHTTINLLNCEADPVALTLTAYDEFGRELGVVPGLSELAGGQNLALDGAALLAGTATLKIEAQGRIIANASLISADGTQIEAIPALDAARQLVFPLLPGASLAQKRFTLLNTGAEAAYIELVALNRNGGELMRAPLPPLEVMASRSLTPGEVFSAIDAERVEPAGGHTRRTQPEVASIRLISDQPVAGLQTIAAPRGDLWALQALAAGSRALTFHLPLADEAPELQSVVWLFNPGENPSAVSIEALDAENQSLGVIEQSELQPGALQAVTAQTPGAMSLRVQADQPVCGYQVISAAQNRGRTAALGIAEEEQTIVGYELTVQANGGALAAYALARMADGGVSAAYEREAAGSARRLGNPSGGDIAVNATAPSYPVSGRVTTSNGAGLKGVTITFSRVSGSGQIPKSVQTNADGYWAAAGFILGTTYRATPSLSGYIFNPLSRDFSLPSSTINFTGMLLYTVSGRVTTSSGVGISFVTITFSRVSGTGQIPRSVQTSASGYWSAGGFVSGTTYSAIPSKGDYIFNPGAHTFSSPSTSLNFTGVLPYAVSGRVTLSDGFRISGVTITFSRVSGSGPIPNSVRTDAYGYWAAAGFVPGTTYRATPSLDGFKFDPVSRDFSSPSTSLNFTGTPPYNVSGRVTTSNGAGRSGVAITFLRVSSTGQVPAPVLTDANGYWSAGGFFWGVTYSATPSKTGYTFTPASRNFSAPSTVLNFISSP